VRWRASLVVVLTAAAPVSAQEGRRGTRAVAFDTVIGLQDFFADARQSLTQIVVDGSMTVEVSPGVQASFRPKLWRTRGDWRALVDQASVRYDFRKGSNWRVEAGRFPSPMGLGVMENRPNLNGGVVWYHRPYYMPLPSLGTGAPRVSLVSTVYPEGAQVSTSGERWDTRLALVDRAPVEFWSPDPPTSPRANVIVGGGITPRQGLRLGVASAAGRLATPMRNASWTYRLVNVEGEWAFAGTKLSGEWTRDTFDTPGESQSATGWTLQARHTLTPRTFVHSRASVIAAPAATGAGFSLRTYRAVDSTVGYLINPEVTLRVGHSATRSFTSSTLDHQVGASLMWSRRWW